MALRVSFLTNAYHVFDSNVKIVNSVLCAHVTVLDECVIQNSCVGADAYIEPNTVVKDDQLRAKFQTDKNVAEYKEGREILRSDAA
jgi:ADP-glucose pyrophosphorylase